MEHNISTINRALSSDVIDALLPELKEAIIITDLQLRVTYLNRAAESLTGYSCPEIKGKDIKSVLRIYEENTGINIIESAIKEESSRQGNVSYHNTILETNIISNTRITLSVLPLKKGNETIHGFILMINKPKSMLNYDNALFDDEEIEPMKLFIAGIVHDFNSILANVMAGISMASLLNDKKGHDQTKMQSYLNIAEEGCIKARDLSRELMDYSKEKVTESDSGIIHKVIRNCVESVCCNNSIKRDLIFTENPYIVDIDSSKLERVINNIVQNAVQSMPDGGLLSIKTENCTIDSGLNSPYISGRYLKISVSDTGQGIDSGDASEIFKPFFTRKEKGTGLGLVTSKSIIEDHNGYIDFQSEPGNGTSFYIYLYSRNAPKVNEDSLISASQKF